MFMILYREIAAKGGKENEIGDNTEQWEVGE